MPVFQKTVTLRKEGYNRKSLEILWAECWRLLLKIAHPIVVEEGPWEEIENVNEEQNARSGVTENERDNSREGGHAPGPRFPGI